MTLHLVLTSYRLLVLTLLPSVQVYDAINEHEELPNIEYPDSDSEKAIIEFHACKSEGGGGGAGI